MVTWQHNFSSGVGQGIDKSMLSLGLLCIFFNFGLLEFYFCSVYNF